MSANGFNDVIVEQEKSKVNQSLINKQVSGKITEQIGSGENAKNSFIWMTITWSFFIGTGISFLIYIRSFFFDEPNTNLLIESLASVWSIFVPLITLALGYAFGKGETK